MLLSNFTFHSSQIDNLINHTDKIQYKCNNSILGIRNLRIGELLAKYQLSELCDVISKSAIAVK